MTTTERLLRYGLVGLVATAAHYVVMLTCIVWRPNIDPVLASTAGALTGMLVGYGLNSRVTYKSDVSLISAIRYASVSASALGLNAAILALLMRSFAGALWPSQIVATGLVFFATYFVNLRWSFSCQERSLFRKA